MKQKVISIFLLLAMVLSIPIISHAEEEPTIVRTPIEYNDKAASGHRIRFDEKYNGTYIRPSEWPCEAKVGYIHIATVYNFINGGFQMIAKYDPRPVMSYEAVKDELAEDLKEANYEKLFKQDFGFLEYKASEGGHLEGETKFYVVRNATNGLTVNYNLRMRDFKNANKELGGFTMPKPVADKGYQFIGWKFDGVSDENQIIHGDVTATAQFKKIYKVTFDSNGGSEVEAVEVLDGDRVAPPANPVLKGKTFEGWETIEGNNYDFGSEVHQDITLKASWSVPFKKINELPTLEVHDKTITVDDELDIKTLIVNASDKEDGNDLKDKVVIQKGEFTNKKAGEYTVIFLLTDSQGAEVEAVAKIIVQPKPNPQPQPEKSQSEPRTQPEKTQPEKSTKPVPSEETKKPTEQIKSTKTSVKPQTGEISFAFISLSFVVVGVCLVLYRKKRTNS